MFIVFQELMIFQERLLFSKRIVIFLRRLLSSQNIFVGPQTSYYFFVLIYSFFSQYPHMGLRWLDFTSKCIWKRIKNAMLLDAKIVTEWFTTDFIHFLKKSFSGFYPINLSNLNYLEHYSIIFNYQWFYF